MSNAEHKIDRAGWARGTWDEEPDRVEWRASGLPCLAVRNHSGAWCGYVGLPPGHTLHGVDYDSAYEKLSEGVHGGLTYADRCSPPICHVPAEGESDDVWWLGFDCFHGGDAVPRSPQHFAEYRDLTFVTGETESLASQLAGVKR